MLGGGHPDCFLPQNETGIDHFLNKRLCFDDNPVEDWEIVHVVGYNFQVQLIQKYRPASGRVLVQTIKRPSAVCRVIIVIGNRSPRIQIFRSTPVVHFPYQFVIVAVAPYSIPHGESAGEYRPPAVRYRPDSYEYGISSSIAYRTIQFQVDGSRSSHNMLCRERHVKSQNARQGEHEN